MQTAVASVKSHRFTITDYLRMGEAGILELEDRVELVDGQVVAMSPIGSWHRTSVERLTRILAEQIPPSLNFSPQSGLNVGEHTQLVPDILVARLEDPWNSHLYGGDCLLVIEVAFTSLRADRTTKKAIYASAGVPEYWIVDLAGRSIEVYLDVKEGEYRNEKVYRSGDLVPCASLPGVSVPVADVVPPPDAGEVEPGLWRG